MFLNHALASEEGIENLNKRLKQDGPHQACQTFELQLDE